MKLPSIFVSCCCLGSAHSRDADKLTTGLAGCACCKASMDVQEFAGH